MKSMLEIMNFSALMAFAIKLETSGKHLAFFKHSLAFMKSKKFHKEIDSIQQLIAYFKLCEAHTNFEFYCKTIIKEENIITLLQQECNRDELLKNIHNPKIQLLIKNNYSIMLKPEDLIEVHGSRLWHQIPT